MKKTLFIVACTLASFTMGAQQQVVKDAEKAMKGGKPYTVVFEMIQPAMSDNTTAQEAITYYIPGKAGFNEYDNLLGKRQLGMGFKEGQDEVIMANALIGGYENYVKALPLDEVKDAKGKVKTKYTKEILGTIAGHYNDFASAGVDFYNAKDYENALKAWDIFVNLSENPENFGIKPDKVQPDTIVAGILFNSGIVASVNGDNKLAAEKFKSAVEKQGYENETAWEYGLSTAVQSSDADMIYFFATEGNKRYGKTNPTYINNLINYYVLNDKADEGIKFIEQAIAQQPDVAQYYALEGYLYGNKNDLEKSKELYYKALEIDPQNGLANYNLGRAIVIEASQMDDAYDGPNYSQFKTTKLFPQLKEGAKYLEAAFEYDEPDREEILKILDNIYYLLEDEAGLNSVKQRQLDLD